jgi:hypothetical protein
MLIFVVKKRIIRHQYEQMVKGEAHMADYDDDNKPDWREIDRRREKSGFYGRQEKGEKKERPKDRWQAGRVKNALDRLFMGEKGTVEHDKMFGKLHASYGSGTFLKHVTAYIDKYGLPDDSATLLLILDTKDEKIILDALGKLQELYGSLASRQKDDVKRKISILAMADRSREVRKKATEVMAGME